jgi:hypothetical protein
VKLTAAQQRQVTDQVPGRAGVRLVKALDEVARMVAAEALCAPVGPTPSDELVAVRRAVAALDRIDALLHGEWPTVWMQVGGAHEASDVLRRELVNMERLIAAAKNRGRPERSSARYAVRLVAQRMRGADPKLIAAITTIVLAAAGHPIAGSSPERRLRAMARQRLMLRHKGT